MDIGDILTRPASVTLYGTPGEGEITIREGKFHQIKRMFEAVGSKIVFLERIRFGGVELDETLERGQWRYLTEAEVSALKQA